MNIIVCSASGLGNAITALPMTQAVIEMGHKVSVRIAAERGTRELFENLEGIGPIYDHHDHIPKHDLALCTHICGGYTNATCKIAEKHFMIPPGHTGCDRYSIKRYTKHEFEHDMDLARRLGWTGKMPNTMLPIEPAPIKTTRKHIGIGLGHYKNEDGIKKHWGNQNFSNLCRLLISADYIPVLLGGDDDKPNAEEIISMAREYGKKIVDMTGVPMGQTFHFMANCGLLITNETMLVPASRCLCNCISFIFDEALHNSTKTYPYPTGVALCGKKKDITPGVVFGYFKRMLDNGPWAKTQPVPDTSISLDIESKTTPACVKAGLYDNRPALSVVSLLCDFHNEQELEVNAQSLNSILENTADEHEVIAVVNAPSEPMLQYLNSINRDNFMYITTSKNCSVVAKNLGYNVAQGDIVASVDGDVFAGKGWAEKILEAFAANKHLGVTGPCGARLRYSKWTRGMWPCHSDNAKPYSACGYEDTTYFGEQTRSGVDGEIVDVIPSMVWGVRRELFDVIGMLDWRYGPFVGSDADFCLRVKEAGYSIALTRLPVTHNNSGGTSHGRMVQLGQIKRRHVEMLYDEWHSKPELFELGQRNEL